MCIGEWYTGKSQETQGKNENTTEFDGDHETTVEFNINRDNSSMGCIRLLKLLPAQENIKQDTLKVIMVRCTGFGTLLYV